MASRELLKLFFLSFYQIMREIKGEQMKCQMSWGDASWNNHTYQWKWIFS
jgi:hypothetical protein